MNRAGRHTGSRKAAAGWAWVGQWHRPPEISSRTGERVLNSGHGDCNQLVVNTSGLRRKEGRIRGKNCFSLYIIFAFKVSFSDYHSNHGYCKKIKNSGKHYCNGNYLER